MSSPDPTQAAPRRPGRTVLKVVLWVVGILVVLVLLFVLFEYVAPRVLPNQY